MNLGIFCDILLWVMKNVLRERKEITLNVLCSKWICDNGGNLFQSRCHTCVAGNCPA